MTQILLIFVTALLFSILATPLARRLALYAGIVDAPSARKLHGTPVPLLGGAAIYAGFMLALLFLGDRSYVRELVGILLGATLVSLFGLADDHWGLHAYLKLGGQVLAGVILILGGTQVSLFANPWLNWAITLLWVVGITNALNLLDYLDGLSGGVSTVAATFFLLLAAMGRPPQVLVGAMAAALVGTCIGFLRYNLNPATIFMGDTGALFLGFLLAALGIKLRFPSNVPWITWLVPLCVLALLFLGDRFYVRELVGILLGATLVSLFGLADDHWGLHAYLKLGGQVLAGVILILGGTQVSLFANPWLNWAITLLWVVGITNALNLLDNMDGLSGGVTTVAATFFLLLAAMGRPPQILVGALAAALVGACIGFLRYNLNPATIFMGDTGALFLGFLLAALGIKLRFPSNVPWITWLVPLCVLALPIFDTSLVFVSRMRRGKNPLTTPGKDHLSHRMVALGLTRREAVLTCYLIGGACGLVAVYIAQSRFPDGYIAAGLLALAGVAGIIWFERYCPAGVPRVKN